MYFLGDVHAVPSLMRGFLESNEKYCIQLGDFGFIFKANDWKWNKFLNYFAKDYPNKEIYTILGNHENFSSIEKMPIVERFGAKCRKSRPNVFAVERGEILSIENLDWLCSGGGDSLDKEWREPYDSWWPQEKISDKDVEKTVNAGLIRHFDVICSHAMPAFFMERNFYQCRETSSDFALEKIYCDIMNNGVQIPFWIGGHVHDSVVMEYAGTVFRTLNIGESLIFSKEEQQKV